MNKLMYVAGLLVFTLVGSTQAAPPTTTPPTTPPEHKVIAENRPAAEVNLLKDKKYTLLIEKLLDSSFKAKIKKFDGTELLDQKISLKDLKTVKDFLKKLETYRLTLKGCKDKKEDENAEAVGGVLDDHIQFFINQLSFDEEKVEDAEIEERFFGSLIWSLELQSEMQEKKFGKADKWLQDLLKDARVAYKAWTKQEFKLDEFKSTHKAKIVNASATQADKDLAETIKIMETATAATQFGDEACVVTPKKDEKPAATTTTPPATTPKKDEPKKENGIKLSAGPLLGNDGKAPEVKPDGKTPVDTGKRVATPDDNKGVDSAAAVPPVNLEEIMNRLDAQRQQALAELDKQKADLTNALAEIDRLKRDREALQNDPNRDDLAQLANAIRDLGKDNDDKPVIPQVTPAAPAASEPQKETKKAQLPQKEEPEEKEEPNRFQPPAPYNTAAAPIIIGGGDAGKEQALLNALKSERQPLPTGDSAKIDRLRQEFEDFKDARRYAQMPPQGQVPGRTPISARIPQRRYPVAPTMYGRRPGGLPGPQGGFAATSGVTGRLGSPGAAPSSLSRTRPR